MDKEVVRREIREALFQELSKVSKGKKVAAVILGADKLTDVVMKRLESLDPTVLERPGTALPDLTREKVNDVL